MLRVTLMKPGKVSDGPLPPKTTTATDELLSRAEAAQYRRLRRAEGLAREAHEAVSRLRRVTAATRAERGELSLTRLDYLQAAQHFKFAANLVFRRGRT